MIVIDNYELYKKTTFKIGGIAKKLYIPENVAELIDVAKKAYDHNKKTYIISGGSNLLINDNKTFESVISMEKACLELEKLDDSMFYIGASNRIQKVIEFLNTQGFGGFEALIGLPAMFGGIIYMNAGIGGKANSVFTISDFIKSVKVYDLKANAIKIVEKEKCDFGHRSSVFKQGDYVILGAFCTPKVIDQFEAEEKKQKRRQYCKDNFDYASGCFGTCFSERNGRILKIISLFYRTFHTRHSVNFSNKNANWLINKGQGTYLDAIKIIKTCESVHNRFGYKIEREVVVWE